MRAEKAKRAAQAERDRVATDQFGIRERCTTLAGFVREAWALVEPGTDLIWNWHLDALCLHLEAVTAGTITRLLVNVPPGSSKSLICSVLWPAWEWTNPRLRSLRYLTTSFNEIPVKRDARKTRDLLQSEWYRTLWPELILSRAGEMSFANTATGSREGVPFGSLTSQRGDRLIIDDPHSTKTAESEADRTETVRLFLEGAINRLNDQKRSAIVVIMQRLHELDVSGAILKRGMGFDHLCLPMEFEADRRCQTRIGFSDPRTYDGELLDPVRFPRDVIERDFKPFSYSWAGQYQQRPAPREGGLFKRHWFKIVTALPSGCRNPVRGWDLGATEGGGDPTAGVKAYRDGKDGGFYFTNAIRQQLGAAGVEALITNTARADGPGCTIRLPQDPGAAGKSYVQILMKALAGFPVKSVQPTGDKVTRALALAGQAEAGNVFLLATGNPATDAWIEPFIDELCVFPSGAHDDQVDAAADAFNELALAQIAPTAASGTFRWG